MKQEKSPTVFISYSWVEREFGCKWVENLANKLRADGIDADIDMYHDSPAEGWTTWMINKIKHSDFVLVVCTESYYDTVNSGKEIYSGFAAGGCEELVWVFLFYYINIWRVLVDIIVHQKCGCILRPVVEMIVYP